MFSLFWLFLTVTEQMCVYVAHVFVVCGRAGAIKTYVSAAMALQYAELPDYAALRGGLAEVLLQQGGSLEQPLSTCTS